MDMFIHIQIIINRSIQWLSLAIKYADTVFIGSTAVTCFLTLRFRWIDDSQYVNSGKKRKEKKLRKINVFDSFSTTKSDTWIWHSTYIFASEYYFSHETLKNWIFRNLYRKLKNRRHCLTCWMSWEEVTNSRVQMQLNKLHPPDHFI